MAQDSTRPARCAGIDVGKAWLDLALDGPVMNGPVTVGDAGPEATEPTSGGSAPDLSKGGWRERNDADGHAAVIATLARHGVEQVGLEATGSYEFEIAETLRRAGFTVVVFQPRQVKAYGVFRLRRAKSDRIDARLIAQCTAAQIAQAEDGREPPDPRLIPLAEHLTAIEQIDEDLARAKIRRERFRDARHLDRLAAEIARLTQLKRAEQRALVQALRALPDLARKLDLLLSIPGIGERTALALVIRMPELGRITRQQAAALVGVAPFVHDSGRHKGQRRTGGGRARLRTSLYAAAQVAALRWNESLVALYKRLRAADKPHALAVIACVRKLVVYANAVIERDQPWQTA